MPGENSSVNGVQIFQWLAEYESSSTCVVERMYVDFDGPTGRHRHSHCCLEDFSGVKNGREILVIGVEVEEYSEIVKMHFSPKVISTTPSSQPEVCQPGATLSGVYGSKAPGMTSPTPMCVTKGPRPLDESNL